MARRKPRWLVLWHGTSRSVKSAKGGMMRDEADQIKVGDNGLPQVRRFQRFPVPEDIRLAVGIGHRRRNGDCR